MSKLVRSTLCYIRHEGCWLMMFRDRKPDDMNEGKWLGIGGKIEEGETPDSCNAREILEETGLVIRSAVFHGVIKFRSDEYDDEDMYLYSSDDFEPADPEALSEFRATGVYELPECDEGRLEWIEEDWVMGLPMWEGDKAFLGKLLEGKERISMTLRYVGDTCIAQDDDLTIHADMTEESDTED